MMANAFIIAACLTAGAGGFLVLREVLVHLVARSRRTAARKAIGASGSLELVTFVSEGLAGRILHAAVNEALRAGSGGNKVEAPKRDATHADRRSAFDARAVRAGIGGIVSYGAYRHLRVRLAVMVGVAGGLFGAILSNELALLLGGGGLALGFVAPSWALGQEEAARSRALEKELPEMLEVIALGLRSGLSFDRSFGLYPRYFPSFFARCCDSARQKWEFGLATREEALRSLAGSFDSPVFKRVVDQMVRSLRFGSSLVETLEGMADETRAAHRARQEERVAKAPVKMMVPTGTLILPAMLIMVLGPILLELADGM